MGRTELLKQPKGKNGVYKKCILLLFSMQLWTPSTSNIMHHRSSIGSNEGHLKIIGGNKVRFGDYSWFVSASGCGGSLITPYHVLTAGHCAIAYTSTVTIGFLCEDTDNCGQNYENFTTERSFIHPNYTLTKNEHTINDFAIVRLSGKSSIPPVKMDEGDLSMSYTKDTSSLWIIGNGMYSRAGYLLHANVAYIPQSTCNQLYSGIIKDSMMCAASPGKDSCQGDSGGPLYDKENGVLVGVVSWGYGCADISFPGVYARISDQWSWIKETVCNDLAKEAHLASFCTSEPTLSPAPTLSLIPSSNPTFSKAPSINPTMNPTWADCDSKRTSVAFELTTDDHPSEISWDITDVLTREVIESGNGQLPNTKYFYHFCLPQNLNETCHELRVYDSIGDGISPPGGYKITVDNKLILSFYDGWFQSHQATLIGCSAPLSCSDDEISVVLELTPSSFAYAFWVLYDVERDEIVEEGEEYMNVIGFKSMFCLPRSCYDFSLTYFNEDVNGLRLTVDGQDVVFDAGSYSNNWITFVTEIGCSPSKSPMSITLTQSRCNSNETKVFFELTTDWYPVDTSWQVINIETGSIVEMGYMETLNKYSSWTFCLPQSLDETCHNLVIYDRFGDGMISPGGYSVSVNNDLIAYEYKNQTWTNETVVIGCFKTASGIESNTNSFPTLSGPSHLVIIFSVVGTMALSVMS